MSETAKQTSAAHRRPRWRRLLKWTLSITGVLLLVIALLIAWVAGTRSGLDFAWSMVKPRLPDTMAVAKVEGRLIGPLTVSGIKLDTAAKHISANRIHLEWRAADLLTANVHIQKLTVAGLQYVVKKNTPEPPPQTETKPFTLPDAIQLPVTVQIDQVAVDDVSVVAAPGAKPLVLAQARVQDIRLAGQQWHIGSLAAHGPLFDINAQAQLTPHDDYATSLSLDAQLRPPGLAPIKTSLKLSGNLDRMQLKATVAKPYNVSLKGEMTSIALNALENIGIDATLALNDTRLKAVRDDWPAVAPITTTLYVSGTPAQLVVEQTVAAPYNANLNATLAHVLKTPQIQAQLKLAGTQLAAIKQDLPPVKLDTAVTVAGNLHNLVLQLNAQANSNRFGVVNAAAKLQYTPQAITIKHLAIKRPDTPMRLTANGTVALAQGHTMDVRLGWQSLRWPLAGEPAYKSKSGQIQLTGTLDDYNMAGHLRWQVAGQAAGKLRLTGSGDLQSFHLAQLEISGGPGDISATADVTWAPALAAQAHIEGEHINPGAVVADVSGDFALVADVRAKQNAAGAIIAHVDTLTADGTLRDQPLALDAELAYLGDHVRIAQLALDYGQTQAQISGRAGWTADAPLKLHWSVESDDLSSLWPTLAGALRTTGQVTGTVSTPSADATLHASNIAYADYQVGRVELAADIDWSGQTRSQLEVDIANVKAAGQRIASITADLTGTPSAHGLTVDVDGQTAEMALELDGSLNKKNQVWDFTLTALQAAYGKLAPWTLAAPAAGQLSATAQRVTDACLTSGDARLCVTGEHSNGGTTASLKLTDLAFSYVKPLLPDNRGISGALSGTVKAQLPTDGQPEATIHLRTTAGKVMARQRDDEKVKVLAFQPANIDATLAAKTGLEAHVKLPLVEAGAIKARFAVAPGTQALTARPLTGALHIDVTRLDFVTRIVAQIAEIDGRITGDMQISGTLAEPRVLGEVALNADRLVLRSPGLVLTGVKLNASGHGDAIDLSLAAQSGGGKLAVDGSVAFGHAGPSIDLAISGHRFQIANTPMVRAWISPDLNVSTTAEQIRVSGLLKIPKARITPHDLPAAGVQTVASDAVIVNKKQSTAQAVARAIRVNVKVVLGDVRLNGFGLKTGITGDLRVRQAPGEPVTAAGKLTLVDGSYRAYGQNLDIQDGRIFFSGGPIANPGIKLRAARYPAEDITVGVQVTGSVTKPKLTLFSDPAMRQAEILSWLLLGRPLEGTTGGQDNLIAKAALALGSGRGNKVLDNLGDALGLDNIGIGSAAGHGAGDAAFMIGKYLTPRLYISYGVGIFSSVSTLGLRYTLNSHWKLKSESSGVATGADIVYTFER